MAKSAHTADPNDPDFQHEAASILRGVADALKPLNAYKGLANYDMDDSVEECLKNVVDSTKEIMDLVYESVKEIPVLGPILGPSKPCFARSNALIA